MTQSALALLLSFAGKRSYSLEPQDLGIPRCTVQDLAGGDAALNARILMVGGRATACSACLALCRVDCGQTSCMAHCSAVWAALHQLLAGMQQLHSAHALWGKLLLKGRKGYPVAQHWARSHRFHCC